MTATTSTIDAIEALAAWATERGYWISLHRFEGEPEWSASLNATNWSHSAEGPSALAALQAAVRRLCAARGWDVPEEARDD